MHVDQHASKHAIPDQGASVQVWFSWDEVESMAASLHIPSAPVLYSGTFDSPKSIQKWMEEAISLPSTVGQQAPREGFVIR